MKLRSGCRAMLAFVFAGFLLAPGCTGSPENSEDGVGPAAVDTLAQSAGSSARVASAIGEACAAPTQPGTSQKLIINEMMIDPAAVTDEEGEWIELYNPTATAVNIQGWHLRFGAGGDDVVIDALTVDPDKYLVLCSDKSVFEQEYPGVTCGYQYFLDPGTRLFNSGDTFTLIESDGSTVSDSVNFTGNAPTGAAMALRNPYLAHAAIACPASPNDPAAWVDLTGDPLAFGLSTTGAAGIDKGTPGARNADVWTEVTSTCGFVDVCTPQRCVKQVCVSVTLPNCCVANGTCNDSNPLTDDSCDLQTHTCKNTPRPGACKTVQDCIDNGAISPNPCDTEYCTIAAGQTVGTCTHSGRTNMACCWVDPDLDPRTGLAWDPLLTQTQRDLLMQAATSAQCDDKNVCTLNTCNMGPNQSIHTCDYSIKDPAKPNCCIKAADCAEQPTDNPCTYNICSSNVCSNPPIGNCCRTAADCDDSNLCTTDLCSISQCVHRWNVASCCRKDSDCVDDGNLCTSEICIQSTQNPIDFECVHPTKADCTLDIPYVQRFETPRQPDPLLPALTDAQMLASIGWKIVDTKTSTVSPVNHWLLTTMGQLGHDHQATPVDDPPNEQSFLFSWTPTTYLVKSVAVSPTLNASKAPTTLGNFFKETTLQWRMAYKDSHATTGPVTLRVVASTTGDFTGSGATTLIPMVNGVAVNLDNLDRDIEYTLFTAVLPGTIKASPTLKIGFLIDTGSTFNMDSWEIDDVTLAAGRPNTLVKSIVLRCPDSPTAKCEPGSPGVIEVAREEDPTKPVPAVTGSVNDRYRVFLCMYDADGYYSTWQTYGFPAAFIDSDPMDKPTFVTVPTKEIGQGNGCNTTQQAVQTICGVPAVTVNGYFYCGIDVNALGNPDFAGAYHAALVVRDEYSTTASLHSPFESQVKFDVNLLLEEGYVVWSPNGREDPAAVAIYNAIAAQTSAPLVQIVQNLAMLSDLNKFKGIFAVLGIHGTEYVPTGEETARLKDYLAHGGYLGRGGLYLEGGKYFSGQASSELAPLFKIDAVAGGDGTINADLTGRNFLHQYDFEYPLDAHTNYDNDLLAHTPKLRGREIFRTATAPIYATAVSYEGSVPGQTATYRTIGSSVLFSGITAKSGGKSAEELMAKYLDFLENGYPRCTMVSQCQDDDVCTIDTCGPCSTDDPLCAEDVCANEERIINGSTCQACADDRDCPDNWACQTDISKGYCGLIDFDGRYNVTPGLCGVTIPNDPTRPNVSVACPITVSTAAGVNDLQVQVRLDHGKRGDLKLTLVSPVGTRRDLKLADVNDYATTGIHYTYDMGVPSAGDLSGFNGEHLNGDWTLIAEDVDPAIYNGLFQDWSLFAKYSALHCTGDEIANDCPDTDGCAPNPACVGGSCVYTPITCNDNKPCTIDYCDPVTFACRFDPIPGTGCPCENHDECGNEACLNAAWTTACNPAVDPDCECAPITGTVYEMTGLPDAIPDFGSGVLTETLPITSAKRVDTLKVRVKTVHPARGNLRVRLCHESVCVTLRDMLGGSVPGFHDIYDYNVVAGPGTIADFKGLPVGGDWTLSVADRISGRTGTLDRFALYIKDAVCFVDSDCDDGDACTADTCSTLLEGGTCHHTAVVCAPSGNQCETTACDPAQGGCVATPVPDGRVCEDGQFCTVGETCQTGTCMGGLTRDCSDRNGQCQIGVCDEALRACTVDFLEGSSCDDNNVCTVGDTCSATGQCVPGTTFVCPCPSGLSSECHDNGNKCDGVVWTCNAQRICVLQDPQGVVCPPAAGGQCSENVCDPMSGLCFERPKLNYAPCDDGLWCMTGERCINGDCTGAVARDCSSEDELCKVGVCDETFQRCSKANRADTTSCEADGDGCTVDHCIGGTCVFNTTIDCAVEDPSTQDDCNDPKCTSVGYGNHTCSKTAKEDINPATGEPFPCTDEPDFCTQDQCTGGLCVHLRDVNCTGPCGGDHPFDEGDVRCGVNDFCNNGINLNPNGICRPLPDCVAPNCVEGVNTPELPIDETITVPGLPVGCVEDTIDLATTFAYVDSVVVKMKLNHSSLQDLEIYLIDPQDYQHLLWNHLGDSNDNFSNTFGVDAGGDLSFPVPYPGKPISGVPLCSLHGEKAQNPASTVGTWKIRVCDKYAGDGGILYNWRLMVNGSSSAALNPGHRCSDAITLPIAADGTQNLSGTTECGMNQIENVGCGWMRGPERLYKFHIVDDGVPGNEDRRRITVRLNPSSKDQVVFIQEGTATDCGGANRTCTQYSNPPVGTTNGKLDIVLTPGWYYLGVDTVGSDSLNSRFDFSDYAFSFQVRTPAPDGTYCMVEASPGVLASDDMICSGSRCNNGYCCSSGTCCPNPGDWTSSALVCGFGRGFDLPASCLTPTACQGEREDPNCDATHKCVHMPVQDDSACDSGTFALACGYYADYYCNHANLTNPSQDQPIAECPTFCIPDAVAPGANHQDSACDPGAHCDPVASTDPDNMTGTGMACVPDLPNGSACNEWSDCDIGRCVNGFCCASGDCCPANDPNGWQFCPDRAPYVAAAACTVQNLCEGQRTDRNCHADNQCYGDVVRDDCACSGLDSVPSCEQLYQPPECPFPAGATTRPQACALTGDQATKHLVGWDSGGSPPCVVDCTNDKHPLDRFGQPMDCRSQTIQPICPQYELDDCVEGAKNCCPPTNPTCCCEDDTRCIEPARCEPRNTPDDSTAPFPGLDAEWWNKKCMGPVANGYPCDENADCVNKYPATFDPPGSFANNGEGWCKNSVCCDSGDCCASDAECTVPRDDDCDVPACQGHFHERHCNTGLLYDPGAGVVEFSCKATEQYEDDSICTAAWGISDLCGSFRDYYCNGLEPQFADDPARCPQNCRSSDPQCAVDQVPSCTGCPLDKPDCCCERDDLCDPGFHCDPERLGTILAPAGDQTKLLCLDGGQVNDPCDENTDCTTGTVCQMHYCCTPGECCNGCLVGGSDLLGDVMFAAAGTGITAISSPLGSFGTTWGQGSPTGRLTSLDIAPGVKYVDTGFLTPTTVPLSCYNGHRDANETDVDCGGVYCPKCADFKLCAHGSDCESDNCLATGGGAGSCAP